MRCRSPARCVAGGLPVIEVTLRTKIALEAVRAIVAEVPQAMSQASVRSRSRADIARACATGARFLVSPGTPASLTDALADAPVPVLPGCATVSEAMALAERGFAVLKFFPAEPSGGARWLKAIAAPLPQLKFCPTGGIDAGNAASYLALSNVISVGGSWVAPADAIAARDFGRIAALAQAAVRLR